MAVNTAQATFDDHELVSSDNLAQIERIAKLGRSFDALRETACAQLGRVSFPTGSTELWRYTKPDGFKFPRLLQQGVVDFQLAPLSKQGNIGAIQVKSGSLAVEAGKEVFAEILGEKGSDLHEDAISALQLATVSSVLLIVVPRSYRSEATLKLSQILPLQASASALIVISVEKGAQVSIVEDLDGGPEGLFAPRVEVLVGDGATVTFCSVQRFDSHVTYCARHRFHTGRDSKLSTLHLALGAKLGRLDLDLKMYAPGAIVNLLGLYLVDGHRHIDFHPTQYHLAPHCRSDLFSKGVLRDEAHSVYYGYIRVAEGAQKTDAYQTNRNLILSHAARADSIPNLEIKANDVRCSHGASVSHVNKEDLFYLMTRGLSRSNAEELLVEGFLEDLLARMENTELRSWLSSLVLNRVLHGC